MRTILILSFIVFGNFSYAQKKVEVERFWISANHGFNGYNDIGGQVQIFDQFLVGVYFQNFQRRVGPGLANNPNALIPIFHSYKKNTVTSGSLLIGFASPTPHSVILSFLVGPSLNFNEIHMNVHIADNIGGGQYISSTETKTVNVGLNYKATLGICLGDHCTLNFGLAGNYSSIEKYNRFIFGFGVGNFGRNKKSTQEYKRIIIVR